MLKKIKVSDARIGMFVQKLDGPWLDHPLWKSRFVLQQASDLEKLKHSTLEYIWIDTDKGDDVAAVGKTPIGPAATPAPGDAHRMPPTASAERGATVSLEQEIRSAAAVVKRGRVAVMRMFEHARLGKAIDADECLPLVQDICDSIDRNPGAVISLARLKTSDNYSYMHSVAVCALMIALARQLGHDESQSREAGMAGLLHDVGKAALPLDVLNKPGKLSPAEYAIVQAHPVVGHQMLLEAQAVPFQALDVCLHHHERPDGRGYPEGLQGSELSLVARMGAICDVYDAITSDRPYKSGWDPAISLAKMASWKGQFDEQVLHAFVRALGIYPTGSLVKLRSGKLAIVLEQSEGTGLSPVVKTFFSTRTHQRLMPERVDLSRSADAIVSREDPSAWGFGQLNELWLDGEILRRASD